MYVNQDPPERPDPQPHALSISVENHTVAGQRRINSGDTIGVQVTVTNRTTDDHDLKLTASLEDLLLADGLAVQAPGTPAGAPPTRKQGLHARIIVNPTDPVETDNDSLRSFTAAPGRYRLSADLRTLDNNEVVAHASVSLDIEVDPPQSQDWPPFQIRQISGDEPYPRWRFRKESQEDWILEYPVGYPLYRALNTSGGANGSKLSGASAFVVEVCSEGLIEWALEPRDGGDTSRLDQLLYGVPDGANPDRWQDYREKMEELAGLRPKPDNPDEYNRLVRECISLSLNLFESHN